MQETSKNAIGDLIDASGEIQDYVLDARHRLRNLMNAAAALGLDRLAGEMDEVRVLLSLISDRLEGVTGRVLSDSMQRSWQSSANVLHATLAGIEIGQRAQEEADE